MIWGCAHNQATLNCLDKHAKEKQVLDTLFFWRTKGPIDQVMKGSNTWIKCTRVAILTKTKCRKHRKLAAQKQKLRSRMDHHCPWKPTLAD